jgi:uncharacterized SAM-binding protein YcdF (DUF218 family)
MARPPNWPIRAGLVAVGASLAAVIAAELWHSKAARSQPADDRKLEGGKRAVIVLGYPSRRNGSLHAVQKWRTEIGVRSLAAAGDGVLVFTGGRTRGSAVSEAETMAAHARRLRVPDGQILLETQAVSTWQNIKLSLPMIDSYDAIVIASDPIHAARGRRYLLKQRPDLADRLAPADDYRPGERWWLKAAVAGYELGVAVMARYRFQRLVAGRHARPREKVRQAG